MTASLTFIGTPGANYTVPGTHTLVGDPLKFNLDGISVYTDGFTQFVDNALCTGNCSVETLLDWNTPGSGSEAGHCYLNTSLTGFSLILQGTNVKLRKEVAGSGGADIATTTRTITGITTISTSFNTSTGAISVKENGVEFLTGTYTDTLSGLRGGIQHYYPGGGTQLYRTLNTVTSASSASIDDINSGGVIRVGSTGNTISTTNLGTLTTLTVGSVSATSISAIGGDGTFSMPAFVDGGTYQLLGTKTVTAGDGTDSATLSKTLDAPTNYAYVTLSGTLNTTITGVLYNFSPAAVVTDQIAYDSTKGTVDAQGNYEGDFDGTQTMWHIKASDGVTRSYDVITGAGSGLTVNLTGVSATANVGTITPSLGGSPLSVTLTGVGSTANTGTVVASLTAFVAGAVSDNLPKFLVDSIVKLRKTFRKSFRKK